MNFLDNSLMRRIYIFFALWLVFSSQVKAEDVLTPVVAYSKVDKTVTTTGDIIKYEINIDYDKRVKATIPDIKNNLEDFSIVEETKEPEKNIDNRIVKTFLYKIQAKEPGSYIIKPVIIKYQIPENLKKSFIKGSETKTSKIYLDIKSVLKKSDQGKDIDDIKDIENIDVFDYRKFIIYGLGVIFLIGIIFLIYRLFKKKEKDLLPHEWAFKHIELLKKEGINQEKLKPTYFKLSEIFRNYLEKRFEIPALSMTNNQLEGILKNNEQLTSYNKRFINQFIERTDYFKYSDSAGNYDECLELIGDIYNFVVATKPVPEKDKSNAK